MVTGVCIEEMNGEQGLPVGPALHGCEAGARRQRMESGDAVFVGVFRMNGFAIGKGTQHADDVIADDRDAEHLYHLLEHQVAPLFYDRDIDGLPQRWIQMMMNSISSLAWRFSAHRMVMDYTRHCYVPAAGGLSCDMDLK